MDGSNFILTVKKISTYNYDRYSFFITKGGEGMEGNSHGENWEKFCQFIEVLNPCMDDYLYIFDIREDFYAISSGALKRFKISAD